MSPFTPEDVLRLARLARLDLETEDVSRFTEQLNDILAFAAQVQSVDTSSAPELPHAPEASLREDEVLPGLSRDEALGGSAGRDGRTGLFTVPRVIAG